MRVSFSKANGKEQLTILLGLGRYCKNNLEHKRKKIAQQLPNHRQHTTTFMLCYALLIVVVVLLSGAPQAPILSRNHFQLQIKLLSRLLSATLLLLTIVMSATVFIFSTFLLLCSNIIHFNYLFQFDAIL